MFNNDDSALIVTLTIGELRGLIMESIREHISTMDNDKRTPSGNYVYGLRGIQQLFGVSHKTAQAYKDGLIKEAVRQHGRKIVIDADYALELFNKRSTK